MQEKIQTYNGSSMHYETEGEGLPVVLIHGFGEDGTVWHYQRSFLKNHFRLIIPDLPGSGKSELLSILPGRSSFIIDMYAACIKQILDEEGVQKCIVLGHSMGGYIALAFAQHNPERLNGLGLVHSTAFADDEEKKTARRKGIAFIQRYGAHEFLKQSIPNLFAAEFTREHPGQINALIARAGNFTVPALVQYYEAMMERPDRAEILEKTSNPVLFIIGEEDKSVYLQDSLKQC
ncbi:alpha/beta hydrolase, partial [Agriterribacter sp.]|uniref:alpha/beta fold hydrolase n=1 Tax=Agriterribacter sp. TaxID=2821509 RepID=UPI002BB1EDB4